MTKALCYINRITSTSSSATAMTTSHSSRTPSALDASDPSILPDPRILILSVSPDLSTAYIPLMNAIFAAQKLKATLDVCKLYGPDTVFLQQAAHLTGGSYIYLTQRDALLQYLIMSHLPPPAMRAALAVPTQDRIDFRAACFCHKTVVDIGFVCSICLSIFCRPVPVCTTCRTKFPMKTLQRLNASRPPMPANPSLPGTATANTSVGGTPRGGTPANNNGMAAMAAGLR